jgi:hypothetical protein
MNDLQVLWDNRNPMLGPRIQRKALQEYQPVGYLRGDDSGGGQGRSELLRYFPGYFGVKGETVFETGLKELRRLKLPFYCPTKTFASTEISVCKEIETQLKRLELDSKDFYHVWCIIDLKGWEERKKNGILKAH